MHKGNEISPSNRIKIESKHIKIADETNHTLFMEKTTIDDTGDIIAIAKNIAGQVECKSKLTVQGMNFIFTEVNS